MGARGVGPRAVSCRGGRCGIHPQTDVRAGSAGRRRPELPRWRRRTANLGLASICAGRGRRAAGRGVREGLKAPALVILAAGGGGRFGGPQKLGPPGASGGTPLAYAVFHARRAGLPPALLLLFGGVGAPLPD